MLVAALIKQHQLRQGPSGPFSFLPQSFSWRMLYSIHQTKLCMTHKKKDSGYFIDSVYSICAMRPSELLTFSEILPGCVQSLKESVSRAIGSRTTASPDAPKLDLEKLLFTVHLRPSGHAPGSVFKHDPFGGGSAGKTADSSGEMDPPRYVDITNPAAWLRLSDSDLLYFAKHLPDISSHLCHHHAGSPPERWGDPFVSVRGKRIFLRCGPSEVDLEFVPSEVIDSSVRLLSKVSGELN